MALVSALPVFTKKGLRRTDEALEMSLTSQQLHWRDEYEKKLTKTQEKLKEGNISAAKTYAEQAKNIAMHKDIGADKADLKENLKRMFQIIQQAKEPVIADHLKTELPVPSHPLPPLPVRIAEFLSLKKYWPYYLVASGIGLFFLWKMKNK